MPEMSFFIKPAPNFRLEGGPKCYGQLKAQTRIVFVP